MRRVLLALAVTALLPGCAGPLSALDPAGDAARGASTLWWIILGLSAFVFVALSAVLLVAGLWPERLRAIKPRHWIVWGGLVVPGIILVAMVGWSLYLGETLLARPGEGTMRVEVVARPWNWEFRHPGNGQVTADVAHIPAGRAVDFVITSEDVIHSFWIPRLGGKIDAIPGHVNVVRLHAERPGRYAGICAEYCGTGHAIMRFEVVAHDPADYDAALAELAGGQD